MTTTALSTLAPAARDSLNAVLRVGFATGAVYGSATILYSERRGGFLSPVGDGISPEPLHATIYSDLAAAALVHANPDDDVVAVSLAEAAMAMYEAQGSALYGHTGTLGALLRSAPAYHV